MEYFGRISNRLVGLLPGEELDELFHDNGQGSYVCRYMKGKKDRLERT